MNHGRVGFFWCLLWVNLAPIAAAAEPALQAPPGFEVVEFAGDDFVHDCYSMTIDALGRVVVAGPGYIKTLIDRDQDGRADEARLWSQEPRNGAQGMAFIGRTLLCIGDAGLLRLDDANGDDRADGPAVKLWDFQTGGEHDVHAIQQGPDGWWYLLAGNMAKIDRRYMTTDTSAVLRPEHGALLRLKPDLTAAEVYAHGMRNAYDFAFTPAGDVATYDSDEEREISLPSYRPTRVFHLAPGSHTGWVTKSWRRAGYEFDMPPVWAELGRGSPTGVVSYRHTQFPANYHGALFVLDWTYGRVVALSTNDNTPPHVFLSATGEFGFAPTDAEVGPDGSLYVSVGGRGTRGGVFRVKATTSSASASKTTVDALTDCLQAPQPLSSWSRRAWQPAARKLGADAFRTALRDPARSVPERVRAIEIVTELFGGLDAAFVLSLDAETPAPVRARAIWSHGRRTPGRPDLDVIARALEHPDADVARAGLEAAIPLVGKFNGLPLIPGLTRQLGGSRKLNRWLAARVVSQCDEDTLSKLSKAATEDGPQAVVSYAFGWLQQRTDIGARLGSSAPSIALALLEGAYPVEVKLDAARLLQLSLGDCGPLPGRPPAFDGYASSASLDAHEPLLDPLRARIAAILPVSDPELETELLRLVAMLAPPNDKLLDVVLEGLTETSAPLDDVHRLTVAARIACPRGLKQREKIAAGFVRLEPKFAAIHSPLDLNWDDRIKEIYAVHAELDRGLPGAIVRLPEFGRPAHVAYLGELAAEDLPAAIAGFIAAIDRDEHYPWSNDVLFVLGESADPGHRQRVRELYDQPQLRGAVLSVLATTPTATDRALFVQGLENSPAEVLSACLEALEKLPATTEADEQVALVRTLRRLGAEPREYAIRERVIKLLERNTGQRFKFEAGKNGYRPQPEAVENWTRWLTKTHPAAAQQALGSDDAALEAWPKVAESAPWSQGDVQRGAELFQTRSCAQCHNGRSALGPDLHGATQRFSRKDLFTAILAPHRDVSPRYQASTIVTRQGKSHTGMIVYESTDGLLLRNATGQTIRIEAKQIEERTRSNTSIMPSGLLKDLGPQDYADLYAYLESLSRPAAASQPPPRAASAP